MIPFSVSVISHHRVLFLMRTVLALAHGAFTLVRQSAVCLFVCYVATFFVKFQRQ